MMTKVYPTPPRPVETHDGTGRTVSLRKFVSKWENRYNADVSLPGPSMRVIRRIARLIRKAVRRLPPLEPWEMAARASGPPAGPGREWRREDLHERT